MNLSFSTEDEFVNAAVTHLRAKGYTVTFDRYVGEEAEPISLCSLAKRLGVSPSTITDALNHRNCPAFNCRRTPKGQIRSFRPNPTVSAWLIQKLSRR